MCKENALVQRVGMAFVGAQRKLNAKGTYTVMRKGKTRRDKEIGAWANHLANRAEKALENKGFHHR